MPKLKINLNIANVQLDNIHGRHVKIGVVAHETVSPQIMNSLADVISVSEFLDNRDFGIHSITDNDGNIAHAEGLGNAVFYHTYSGPEGHANENFIGIEQISDVMVKYASRAQRIRAWFHMSKELNATAKLIACLARAHDFSIVDNPGDTTKPGITTHWEVTMFNRVAGGHVDCWPSHRGGYYPKRLLITLSKRYYRLGWRF